LAMRRKPRAAPLAGMPMAAGPRLHKAKGA
jgi:hypothetical protein